MEKQATSFAVRIMACRTFSELEQISGEIRLYMLNNPEFKKEFRSWLLDIHWSKNKDLEGPDVPFESTLNAAGKKKYMKGESLE